MPAQPYLDTRPTLGAGVYIHPTALVIGDVALGDHVSIWPMAVVRGDVGLIALDREGNIAQPYNSQGMKRAWLTVEGEVGVDVFGD